MARLTNKKKRKKKLVRTKSKAPNCEKCKLNKDRLNPKARCEFNPDAKVIIVLPYAPSVRDDNLGKITLKRDNYAVNIIKRELKKFIDIETEIQYITVLGCPLGGKPLTDTRAKYCRNLVLNQIDKSSAKLVFLVGTQAVVSVVGNSWSKDIKGVNRWRGFLIPDKKTGKKLMPIIDAIVDKYDRVDYAKVNIVRKDVSYAMKNINKVSEGEKAVGDDVLILSDKGKILSFLNWISEKDDKFLTAFDYETTGLKPFAEGHKIKTVAIAYGTRSVVSFPFYESIRESFVKNYLNSDCGKIIANAPYENLWSNQLLNSPIKNVVWDTLLAAHVLDNRSAITSVKFQTYIRFGSAGYDDDISKFLRADEDDPKYSANSINDIDNAPPNKLLLYCGLDALYEYNIGIDQMKEMDFKL